MVFKAHPGCRKAGLLLLLKDEEDWPKIDKFLEENTLRVIVVKHFNTEDKIWLKWKVLKGGEKGE